VSRIWQSRCPVLGVRVYVIWHLREFPVYKRQRETSLALSGISRKPRRGRHTPRCDLNRELKTSVKVTIVQNQRISDLGSVAEHRANLDEHVKVVTAPPLSDVCSLLHDAPDITWVHVERSHQLECASRRPLRRGVKVRDLGPARRLHPRLKYRIGSPR
jgi:hypothetical protein